MSKILRVFSALSIAASSAIVVAPGVASAATAPQQMPAPVLSTAVNAKMDTQIMISWSTPATTTNGGSSLTGFNIYRNGTEIASATGGTCTVTGGTIKAYTLSGLTASTSYAITISACNAVGKGTPSNAFTTSTAPAPAVMQPLIAGDAKLTLSWTPSGAANTTDTVWYKRVTQTAYTQWTGTVSSSGTEITGLINGSSYHVRVRTSSTATLFSETSPLIGTPLGVPFTPTEFQWRFPSNGGVTLSWKITNTLGYIPDSIELRRNDVLTNTFAGTLVSTNVSGLERNVQYTFKLRACRKTNICSENATITYMPPPPAPSAFSVTASTAGGGAELKWTDAQANTPHTVEYRISPSPTFTTITSTGVTGQSYSATGLVGGTTYIFRVGSIAADGTANYSTEASVVVIGAPQAPTSLTATASTASSVSVSWKHPANTGGLSLLSYTVFVDGEAVQTLSGTATTATVSGLPVGSKRTISIEAVNRLGSSNRTAASLVAYTLPAAPTGLSSTVLPIAATVSWAAATTPETPIYKVTYLKKGNTVATDISSSVSPQTISSLTVKTTYVVTVTACNPTGGCVTSATHELTTDDYYKPTAPQSMQATATAGGATLTWSAPSSNGYTPITNYVISYSTDSGATWTTPTRGISTALSATVTGLTPNTPIVFRVLARNIAGDSPASDPTSSVTPFETPSAPRTVALTPGNKQVTVIWDAPLSDGSNAVTDYVIQHSTNGTTWTTFSDGLNSGLNTVVTGLTNGTNYVFRVAAVNAAGQGAWSHTSAPYPPAVPFTNPSKPTAVTGTEGASGAVNVSWTRPADTGGIGITDYNIQYSSDSGTTWQNFSRTASTLLSGTVTGLDNGTSYVFRVRAVTSLATGEYSDASAPVTPRTAPGAPTITSATPSNSQVVVCWTPNVNNGGSSVLYYKLRISSNAGGTFQTEGTNITDTCFTWKNLANGTAYVFKVAAANGAGAGSDSVQSASATPFTTPGVPSALNAKVINAVVTLTWTAPTNTGGSAITDYLVQHADATTCSPLGTDSCTWVTYNDGLNSGATATVSGLDPGKSFVFRVASSNAAGASGYTVQTPAILISSAAAKPTISSTVLGNQTVALTWTQPSDNGGSDIVDYCIQRANYNTTTTTWSAWTDVSHIQSTALTLTVASLTNGSSYKFQVAARTAYGCGNWSDEVGSDLSVVPRTTPGAPTTLAPSYANSAVDLTWLAPVVTGGAAITDYTIQYSTDNGVSWNTFPHSPSDLKTPLGVQVTGLTNGTSYVFRVAAENAAGTGAYTAPSTAIVPKARPGKPVVASATPADRSVALQWPAPAANGAAITNYLIRFSTDSGANWTNAPDGVSALSTETVSGLANGTSYIFQVRAVNVVGEGEWSDSTTATVPRKQASAPQALAGTAGNEQVTLTWAAPTSDGGTAVTGYIVEYATTVNGPWQTPTPELTLNGSSTTAVVQGLKNGTGYFFQMAAITASGNLVGLSTKTTTAIVPVTIPGSPSNVSGTSKNASVLLTWSPPSSNGGTAITDYAIQFALSSSCSLSDPTDCSWGTFADGTSQSTSATVTGLTNGSSYTFRVAAVNKVGASTYAQSLLDVTPMTIPGIPGALSGVAADQSATLNWSAPADNGGDALTNYVLTMSSNGGQAFTQVSRDPSTATSFLVNGLVNGTSYIFRVYAVNSVGQGTLFSTSPVIIPVTTPAQTSQPQCVPGDGVAKLTWSAPANTGVGASMVRGDGGSVITNYQIQHSSNYNPSDGTGLWTTVSKVANALTTWQVGGLSNGTGYVFRIFAINAVGTGDVSVVSSPCTPRTTPGTPSAITGTVGSGAVALSWTAPVSDGGSPVLYYVVQSFKEGGSLWTTFSSGVSLVANDATVTGLTNGSRYKFRVAAVNAAGPGAYFEDLTWYTPINQIKAPTNLIATPGDAFVKVTWTAPTTGLGETIDDYIIEMSSDGGSNWSVYDDGIGTTPQVTIAGLDNATQYSFRVKTVSGDFTTIPSSPITATPRTKPAAPALSASSSTTSAVTMTVAVASNGGAAITGYAVTCSSSDGGTTRSASGSSTTITVTSLTAEKNYSCTATATNPAGTSAASPAMTLAPAYNTTYTPSCSRGGTLTSSTNCNVPGVPVYAGYLGSRDPIPGAATYTVSAVSWKTTSSNPPGEYTGVDWNSYWGGYYLRDWKISTTCYKTTALSATNTGTCGTSFPYKKKTLRVREAAYTSRYCNYSVLEGFDPFDPLDGNYCIPIGTYPNRYRNYPEEENYTPTQVPTNTWAGWAGSQILRR
jgi:large repetitive protein